MLAALMVASAQWQATAATISWIGKAADNNWSSAGNWQDAETGQATTPGVGDVVTVETQTGVCNDLVGLALMRLVIPSAGTGTISGFPVAVADGVFCDAFAYLSLPICQTTTSLSVYASSSLIFREAVSGSVPFTLFKTGSGCLALTKPSTNLSHIVLSQGSLAFGWQSFKPQPQTDLSLSFAGADVRFLFSSNVSFTNCVLSESSAACGHAFGSHEGRRAEVRLVDCAMGGSCVGFDVESPLSLHWLGTNELAFSRVRLSTTNVLSVASGCLRFRDGAGFVGLSRLELSDGARLVMEAGSSGSVTRFVTDGSRVELGSGVVLRAGTVFADGSELAAGVYDRYGLRGSPLPWLHGHGVLSVGGAEVASLLEPAAASDGLWWYGSAADASVGSAANWNMASLPDLTSGAEVAHFYGGTSVDLDRRVWFRGVELSKKNLAFTSTSSTARALLGSQGMVTKSKNSVHEWNWPTFLVADQSWDVISGSVVNVTAMLGSVRGESLVLGGAGSVWVSGPLAIGGSVSVTNGALTVSCADEETGGPLQVAASKARLSLSGASLRRDVRNISTTGESSITVDSGTTNVIAGDLDLSAPPATRVALGSGSSLAVRGRLRRGGGAWLTFGGGGDVSAACRLEGTVAATGAVICAEGKVDLSLHSPSNELGGATLWLGSSTALLRTACPYALAADGQGRRASVRFGSASPVWELCGEQEIERLECRGRGTVRSVAPAMLRIMGTTMGTDVSPTNAAVFAGAAGVSYEGGGQAWLSGEASSTGTVQVKGGVLTLTAGARWPHAGVARACGGVLEVGSRGAFGRETAMVADEGGRIALNFTGFMRVGRLEANGVAMSAGTYGAKGSGAVHELDCLSGVGRLHVGAVGLIGIVR